jgi:hypothetical protein
MAYSKVITATENVKPSAGKLLGFFCSAASSNPTVTIYNSAAATATKKVIDTFTPVAGTNYFFPGDGIWCDDGIYVVIANTVTLSVIYE